MFDLIMIIVIAIVIVIVIAIVIVTVGRFTLIFFIICRLHPEHPTE